MAFCQKGCIHGVHFLYNIPVQGTLLALGEVMGGSVTVDLASKIWASVGVEIAPHIENKFNYKQFAGIAAITERIFCWNFSKGEKAGPTAPKVNVVIYGFVSSFVVVSILLVSYYFKTKYLCVFNFISECLSLLFVFQSEIETADFDKLLCKLEQVMRIGTK